MDSQQLKLMVDKYAKYDSMRARGVPLNLVRRIMMVDGLKSNDIKNYVEANTKYLSSNIASQSQQRTKRREVVSYSASREASPILHDAALGNSRPRSVPSTGTFGGSGIENIVESQKDSLLPQTESFPQGQRASIFTSKQNLTKSSSDDVYLEVSTRERRQSESTYNTKKNSDYYKQTSETQKSEKLHQLSEMSDKERERLKREELQQAEYDRAKSTHHAVLGNIFIRRSSLVDRFMRKKSNGSISSPLSPNNSTSLSAKSQSNSQPRSHSQSPLDHDFKESTDLSFSLLSPMQQTTQSNRKSNSLPSSKKSIKSEDAMSTMHNSSIFSSGDQRDNKVKASSVVAQDAKFTALSNVSKKPMNSASLRISISTTHGQKHDEDSNRDHNRDHGVESWFTPKGVRGRSTSDHSTASLSPTSVYSPSNLFTYFSPKAYSQSSTDPKIKSQQAVNSSKKVYVKSFLQNSLNLLRRCATSITSNRYLPPKKDSPKLASTSAKIGSSQKLRPETPIPTTLTDEGQKLPANQNHVDIVGLSSPDIIDYLSPSVTTNSDRPFSSIINPFGNTLASTYLSPPSPSHLAVTAVDQQIQFTPTELYPLSDLTSQSRNITLAITPGEKATRLTSSVQQLTEMERMWQSVDRIIKSGRDSTNRHGTSHPSATSSSSSSHNGTNRERSHHLTPKADRGQNEDQHQEFQTNPLQASALRSSRLKTATSPRQDLPKSIHEYSPEQIERKVIEITLPEEHHDLYIQHIGELSKFTQSVRNSRLKQATI